VPTPTASRPAPSDQLEFDADAKAGGDVTTGTGGELLTRAEAFDLVRRTVAELAHGEESIRASAVRARARQLLGRDSQSLSDRMFVRILKDAHDAGIVDLRRRGNDFEVARATETASVADQLAKHEKTETAKTAPPPTAPGPRLGMGPRGAGGRHRPGAPPPELLSVGVVSEPAPAAIVEAHVDEAANGGPPAKAKRTRGSRAATKAVAKRTVAKPGARPRTKKAPPAPEG
jgi:hypothetical protein